MPVFLLLLLFRVILEPILDVEQIEHKDVACICGTWKQLPKAFKLIQSFLHYMYLYLRILQHDVNEFIYTHNVQITCHTHNTNIADVRAEQQINFDTCKSIQYIYTHFCAQIDVHCLLSTHINVCDVRAVHFVFCCLFCSNLYLLQKKNPEKFYKIKVWGAGV